MLFWKPQATQPRQPGCLASFIKGNRQHWIIHVSSHDKHDQYKSGIGILFCKLPVRYLVLLTHCIGANPDCVHGMVPLQTISKS